MAGNAFAVILAVYTLVISIILYRLMSKNDKTYKKRLKSIEALGNSITRESEEEKRKKRKMVVKITISDRLKGELEAAGLDVEAEEIALIWILVATVPPFIVYLLSRNLLLFVSTLLVMTAAPLVFIKFKEKERKEKFVVQLGDALLLIGNCLRSGISFRKSLDRIVKDMPNPISGEFEKAIIQMEYGATMEDALIEIGERMDSHEMELLTSAVSIHQKAGGKLSDVVENVSNTIRENIQLKQSVKTLTAQGRISGIVVGILPIAMLIMITFINPSYMSVFYDTLLGNIMLVVALTMELLGMLVISKIVKIDM